MKDSTRVTVILLGGLFVFLAFVGAYFWYESAHNLDRCSQGYVYALDGSLCPGQEAPSP